MSHFRVILSFNKMSLSNSLIIGLNLRHNLISRSLCSKNTRDYYDPPSKEPPIPSRYMTRNGEPRHVKRARLLYQSRKRGILENDLILGTFAGKYLNHFDDNQLEMYDFLINMPSNEWDLYNWCVGLKEVPNVFKGEVMNLLIEHCKNTDRESRMKQPNL